MMWPLSSKRFRKNTRRTPALYYGKQFTGKEFQYFIALHGLTHVKTSPYYPQSNGKVERFHGTIKKVYIRKKALLDQDHAKIIIGSYITFYNNQRLHSANAYITPADQLAGKDNKYMKKGGKRFMWPD